MDANVNIQTEPSYLVGQYEGIYQQVKVEVPADVLPEVAELYHQVGVDIAEEKQRDLTVAFFRTIGRQL